MIENNQKKSKGGKRPGAGRKTGSLTKRTRQIAEAVATQGITPLEVMMKVMHQLYEEAGNVQEGELGDKALADEARIKLLNMAATVGRHAAPYVHPRLSAIEHTGKDGAPLQSGVLVVPSAMSIDEWEQAAQAKH
ncbi:MAG: hypothetical protein B7Y05_09605 [Polynucleobacter sp. 24-46-87]|jgi:hypothetical protein|uniref:hypothetical protein n=1 Tax=Polynucleobacter sp. 35-46-11 TaxID=1970425 RepID=UPI000BCD4EA0|nr:hypothetical protein [Polynucleobacter sp. 35-46-11]OYY13296.1 MAG: hypothetical protein B7Y67_12515 [Polynucleobacter sp. 35-46-11]OZA13506.1 MAG: hypothetical protein B7Y05_09605 [Polynucleobacter sp. 24-46-87]